MIQKREAEIAAAQKQIEELQNIEETLRNRQAKLKRDTSMMNDILKEGHLSKAHLSLLVDKIYVHEEDGKLSLDICLKAPFRDLWTSMKMENKQNAGFLTATVLNFWMISFQTIYMKMSE